MTNLKNILQHYEKSEQRFVRQVYNDLEDVKYNYLEKNFGFLEQNEIDVVKQLANLFEVELIFKSVYDKAEYVYVVAYNKEMGYEPQVDLKILNIKYNTKFNQLAHRTIMGTLYNSGLDTRQIGDIIVNEEGKVQIIVSSMLEDVLNITVPQIGKVKVAYEEVNEINIEPIPMKAKVYSARSLRLDSICKMLSKISRTKMSKEITSGNVKVNYKVITDTNYQISEEDMISIRGIGRFVIYKIIKVNQKYNIQYGEQT